MTSLVVTAELVTGTYDAATADPSRTTAEWPPHPMRIFGALVDAASQRSAPQGADEAVRWLESQPPPELHAAREVLRTVRGTYVPVNDLPKVPKHTLYPGRISAGAPKVWSQAIPPSTSVRFVWRDAEPSPGTVAALRALARSVPYLGRSTSPAVVSVETEAAPAAQGDEGAWVPDDAGGEALRVPFPGALDALREAYAAGELVHEIARHAAYRGPRDAQRPTVPKTSNPAPVRGPFSDLLTFSLHPAPGLDGSAALAVTTQLRRAVISRIGSDVPSAVHGHTNDVPHVAWLVLPDVGSPHSSGRILGIGIAVPAAMDVGSRRALLAAVIGREDDSDGFDRLALPPPLTRRGWTDVRRWARGGTWTVNPDRWTRASKRWTTVTPVVWDRFTKRDADLEEGMRRSLSLAGYPEPAPGGLSWSRSPFVHGAAQPRPHQVRREGDPPLPYRHVLLEFTDPVAGPIVVGRMRHFGVGLFAPVGGVDGDAAD